MPDGVEKGFKAGLAEAVAAVRAQELQRDAEQLELFGELLPVPVERDGQQGVQGGRGPGRPFGARSRRTDEVSRFYLARHGDPLGRGVEIAALPILAGNGAVLAELAKVLGMERADAAKWWAGIYSSTLPYIHQRLATLSVKPLGSPDGEAVPLSWAAAVEEIYELTAPAQASINGAEDELEQDPG